MGAQFYINWPINVRKSASNSVPSLCLDEPYQNWGYGTNAMHSGTAVLVFQNPTSLSVKVDEIA